MEFYSEYLKKEYTLSRIDARVKIVTALALLAMVLSYRGFVFPVVTAVLCLFGAVLYFKIDPGDQIHVEGA